MPPGRRGNRHETTWDRRMATLPTDWPGWHSYPCPRYPLSVQHSQDERQRTKRGPQGPRGAAGGGKGRASSTTMDLRESGEVSVRGHRRKEVARVSHGQGLSSSLGISQASWTGCGGRGAMEGLGAQQGRSHAPKDTGNPSNDHTPLKKRHGALLNNQVEKLLLHPGCQCELK